MNRQWIARAFAVCCAIGPGLAAADCTTPGQWMVRLGGHNVDPTSTPSNTLAGPVTVSSKAGPTFNVDYTFCKVLTVDLLAALPFTHDVNLNGQKIGSTQHLPPTLTLQYHPVEEGPIDPYVGVGFNYTWFFNSKTDTQDVSLNLTNTFGFAAQLGLDYKLTPHWRVGADVRYLQIEPDASVNSVDIGTVKINPYVYGMNVGYSF